jgi:hypothetical protein
VTPGVVIFILRSDADLTSAPCTLGRGPQQIQAGRKEKPQEEGAGTGRRQRTAMTGVLSRTPDPLVTYLPPNSSFWSRTNNISFFRKSLKRHTVMKADLNCYDLPSLSRAFIKPGMATQEAD